MPVPRVTASTPAATAPGVAPGTLSLAGGLRPRARATRSTTSSGVSASGPPIWISRPRAKRHSGRPAQVPNRLSGSRSAVSRLRIHSFVGIIAGSLIAEVADQDVGLAAGADDHRGAEVGERRARARAAPRAVSWRLRRCGDASRRPARPGRPPARRRLSLAARAKRPATSPLASRSPLRCRSGGRGSRRHPLRPSRRRRHRDRRGLRERPRSRPRPARARPRRMGLARGSGPRTRPRAAPAPAGGRRTRLLRRSARALAIDTPPRPRVNLRAPRDTG